MTVALYTHQDMLDHRPGARHPERPERLQAVTDALSDSDLKFMVRDAPLAAEADLAAVHGQTYLDAIFAARPGAGTLRLDEDTFMSAGSPGAARPAPRAGTAPGRHVAAGQARPPLFGHRP